MSSTDKQRSEVLKLARKMARSGQFADVESIERTLLKVIDITEAAQRIGRRGFRTQLKRLCASARNPGVRLARTARTGGPITSRTR